jgi:hypothetical protein
MAEPKSIQQERQDQQAARVDRRRPANRRKGRSKTNWTEAAPMKVVIAGATGAENLRLVSTVCAAGEALIVAVAKSGADAVRTVLDEEPEVLIIGSRFDPKQGLALLHSVRPLLPALRIVAVDGRPSNEFRRAFLLGEIDLLLCGPDRVEIIPEVLEQWQREKRREPWAAFIGAPFGRSPEG